MLAALRYLTSNHAQGKTVAVRAVFTQQVNFSILLVSLAYLMRHGPFQPSIFSLQLLP